MRNIVLLILVLTGTSAFAHHSAAMYDQSKDLSVKGMVKDFVWTNPHVVLVLTPESKTSGGDWRFEMTSPSLLTRMGWTKRSVRPGDMVTVVCAPMRDGTRAGYARKIAFADGRVLDFNYTEKPNLP